MTVALFARVLDNLDEEQSLLISATHWEIVQSALKGILHVVFILILEVVAARLR
jgi:hypothetical protein